MAIENNTEGLQEILQRVQELPQGINADDFVKKTELQDAVDDALEQAKNSGEFDGKDGTSVTHTWSDTTLRVTSASGTSSANLKGEKGDKGDTGSFNTSQIVNNFTTTAQGFVADARALKVLNDNLNSLSVISKHIIPIDNSNSSSVKNVKIRSESCTFFVFLGGGDIFSADISWNSNIGALDLTGTKNIYGSPNIQVSHSNKVTTLAIPAWATCIIVTTTQVTLED